MGCKFVCTGDLHVGSLRRVENSLQRQAKIFDSIFDVVEKRSDGFLLINADVFDSHSPTSDEKDLVQTKIVEGIERGFKIVVTSGNHDTFSKKRSSLYFLETMARVVEGLTVVTGEPRVVHLKGFPVDIAAMPWTGLESTAFNKKAASLVATCKKPPVVMFHEEVLGCTDDTGWTSEKGIRIDKKLKVNCWVGGHIHKQQQLGKNIWYSGSPIQVSFSEAYENKGVLVCDTDNPTTPEFVHIESTQLQIIQGFPEKFPSSKKVAAIKLIDLAPEDLAKPVPSTVIRRVVRTTTKARQQKQDGVASDVKELTELDLLEQLPAILKARGLDDSQVQFGVQQGQKLLQKFRV